MKSTLLCLILLPVAASIPTASAQSFFGRNLIVNPGAEDGAAAPSTFIIRPIPGWIASGNFTVQPYGDPGGFPTLSSPGPPNRGTKFFSGGPNNASSLAYQVIQVPSDAFTAIDAGTVRYDLSAWLGGVTIQDDNANLKVFFISVSDATLGSLLIGPVLA